MTIAKRLASAFAAAALAGCGQATAGLDEAKALIGRR